MMTAMGDVQVEMPDGEQALGYVNGHNDEGYAIVVVRLRSGVVIYAEVAEATLAHCLKTDKPIKY